ncbi:MAG: apolipoprotein N-acyltransferase [Rhodospirillales bacterium]|nr:MAG: apolipoprotein N-acyltransferase [Rhodospirillales bacterium]
MEALRLAVVGARGWRRAGLAFLLGVMAVGALPPLYIWPLLIPALVGLYWLTEAAVRPRTAFWAAWLFGLGYFTAGLYWIVNAFLVQADQFGWMAPFAVLGLSALLAVFVAGASWVTRVSGVRGIGGVLVFAGAWTGFEWLRSWVLTGFPWNLMGSVWLFSDAMIQVTAVIGTYGLGLITVAAAAMPAVLGDPAVKGAKGGIAVLVAFAIVAAGFAGGTARLAAAGPAAEVPGVRLRLVQPSIPQELKWAPHLIDAHLAAHLRLGAGASGAAPTHLFWGETAAPLYLADDPERLRIVGEFTPGGGVTVLGTLRRTPPSEPFQVWNSLIAIDPDGTVVATYDKTHLVPFGEYVPLRDLLGIDKFTPGATDFSRGTGLTVIDLPGLPPVSPLICYEVIFPARVVPRGERPAWLLNLTNDGWYGISSGPHQHLGAARLRAVEEGLPLVRIANTGISAIIDAHGRVVASLGLMEEGVVDGGLPAPLATPTPYARFGNLTVLAVVAISFALGWQLRRRP